MAQQEEVRRLMDLYPRIFFACHESHAPDPVTGKTLTSRQGSILDHLDPERAMNLKDLAEHMGVTASTMSINVDRLVKLGLVRREQAKGDRRQIDLLLTESGARSREGGEVLSSPLVAQLLARLSLPQRTAALEGLAVLAGAADELVQARFSRRPTDEEEK